MSVEDRLAKTIAVSDDVYELLRKSKTAGETYSDVIRRALKHDLRLMDIAGSGTLTTEEWTRTQKVLERADRLTRAGYADGARDFEKIPDLILENY